jgi:chromosome segregation ATPase
LRKEI